MKTTLRIIALAIVAIALAGTFIGRISVRSDEQTCTKCLLEMTIAKATIGSRTVWERSQVHAPGLDLAAITGEPCDHVFLDAAFGHSASEVFLHPFRSGVTSPQRLNEIRAGAIYQTFALYEMLDNVALARRTLDLIDTIVPPGKSRILDSADRRALAASQLTALGFALKQSQSLNDWQDALARASTPPANP